MMRITNWMRNLPAPRFYNDGDPPAGGGDGSGTPAGEPGGGGAAGAEKKFSQQDLDDKINQRFKKEKQEKESLLTQLKSLQSSNELSKENADGLQTRIDELESSLMTKEEQAAQAQKSMQEKHSKELKKSQEETSLWKGRYEASTIERALTDAAVSADAENPAQIRMMLQGASYLSEDKNDEGKRIGTFTPRVKFQGKNDDGDIVELDLPIGEALTKMRNDELNKNLFKHGARPGTGQQPSGGQGGGRGADAEPKLDDFNGDHKAYSAAYLEWRKTHSMDGERITQEQG